MAVATANEIDTSGVDGGVRRVRRRSAARRATRSAKRAADAGIRPASIHDLYLAMGRGEAGGFTVPAINVRAMAYDTARAVVRVGQEAERRRLHLRNRPLGDRLHGTAAARVRGHRPRRSASRRLHAVRSSFRATTSRRTRRSTTAPIGRRKSRRCAR